MVNWSELRMATWPLPTPEHFLQLGQHLRAADEAGDGADLGMAELGVRAALFPQAADLAGKVAGIGNGRFKRNEGIVPQRGVERSRLEAIEPERQIFPRALGIGCLFADPGGLHGIVRPDDGDGRGILQLARDDRPGPVAGFEPFLVAPDDEAFRFQRLLKSHRCGHIRAGIGDEDIERADGGDRAGHGAVFMLRHNGRDPVWAEVGIAIWQGKRRSLNPGL
jgi:hypothetical protein